MPRPPHKNFSKVMDKYKVVLRFACRHVMDPQLGATNTWAQNLFAMQFCQYGYLVIKLIELPRCRSKGHMSYSNADFHQCAMTMQLTCNNAVLRRADILRGTLLSRCQTCLCQPHRLIGDARLLLPAP